MHRGREARLVLWSRGREKLIAPALSDIARHPGVRHLFDQNEIAVPALDKHSLFSVLCISNTPWLVFPQPGRTCCIAPRLLRRPY
jgi:hypothetical protein